MSASGRVRKWTIKPILAAAIGIGVSNCARVPLADPAASGPSIEKIVARVKCDLIKAVSPYLDLDLQKTNNPNYIAHLQKYAWFQTWTAQVNLNFIVNDQSSLAPGATFIQPLTTESLPFRLTNAQRSANLGVGAGLNTTATRNETITFSMSLREIFEDWSYQPPLDCDRADSLDLDSKLELKEWIAAALTPANTNYLVSGHHKSSKGGGAAPSGGGKTGAGTGSTLSASSLLLLKFAPATPTINEVYQKIKDNLCIISRYEIDDPQDTTNNDQPPTICKVDWTPPTTPKQYKKKILPFVDKELGKQIDNTLIFTRIITTEIRKKLKDLTKDAPDGKWDPAGQWAQANNLLQWAKAVEDYLLPLELDPPIDTISHSVQFIIAFNANVSPNWTLLHFKGPTTGSTFASASKSLTHTLNIAIGPPSSPDTANALSALLTGTAVSNGLLQNGIRPSP